ncbi:MAG: MBL fold metallo-hydrolase [Solirubrobacteraceae bacterium]
MISAITPNLHDLGTELVNFYLLEEHGEFVVFDAGYASHYAQLERELAARGHRTADVAALLLTHGDLDHVGFAERLRREGVPVYLHPADRQLARLKPKHTEASMLPYLRGRALRRFVGEALRSGIPRRLNASRPLRGGETLDLPGRPRVIHVPGHTEGSCAFYLPDERAIIAGDCICTLNPLTAQTGPQLMPPAMNISTSQARASVAQLARLDAELVLPGHGHPWRGAPDELADQITTA